LVIDRTPDWSAATVALGWKDNEQIYTDVVASIVKPDLKALTDLMTTVAAQIPHTHIYLDYLFMGELADALKMRGIQTERLTKRDAVQAPSIAYQKIMEGKVTHGHHQMVGWQLARTITKNVGDAYRLTRANVTVEIDAAIASVLAIYLAEITEPIPTQVF
jgi:phage terminase large subunit-like protein